MERITNFLSHVLFHFGETPVTVSQALAAPLVFLLGLIVTRWVVGIVTARMEKHGQDPNLVLLVKRLFYIVVFAILGMTVLSMLHIPLTAFAFVSGAVAIGVGFGAQNIINNFISGWILMGERPISIGDLVEINDTLGVIESINIRSTRVKRVDGVRIVIPNSQLLENQVVNWTLEDREVRTMVRVGVAYGSPVRDVARLMDQAVREQADVLKEPEPTVIFEDFGDSALVFDAYFFTLLRPGGDLRRLRSEIRFRIDELFAENDIVIAFPQRDVHIDGSIRLER
ncbi:mechanosensitive ion channel [Marinihelvus fidelis]|uniref:Mechanosensitive ion channel n=1 Tax=Marinihelvus fidelis TaxID=2613842 RepID=A0A5N0T7L1_9GAMM|nr:mechanosensitive ion channel domain-containing protein [Marinihelvus fidelis]KAA9129806.1 mechanosensitive ion channel [Marinihelvus fidelis]